MKSAMFAIAALAVSAMAGPLQAQSPIPISVEVRGDAAVPTGSFGDRVDTGVGFGVSASVAVMPNVGVYGSYSRTEFGLTGAEGNAVADGFAAGLTTAFGPRGAVTPWVGAGVLFHGLDVAGTREGDVGFEVGGGVAVPLGPNLRLTPGVGYRQFGAGAHGNVSYVSAGVGLNLAL
jgi:hypothetical protein